MKREREKIKSTSHRSNGYKYTINIHFLFINLMPMNERFVAGCYGLLLLLLL